MSYGIEGKYLVTQVNKLGYIESFEKHSEDGIQGYQEEGFERGFRRTE